MQIKSSPRLEFCVHAVGVSPTNLRLSCALPNLDTRSWKVCAPREWVVKVGRWNRFLPFHHALEQKIFANDIGRDIKYIRTAVREPHHQDARKETKGLFRAPHFCIARKNGAGISCFHSVTDFSNKNGCSSGKFSAHNFGLIWIIEKYSTLLMVMVVRPRIKQSHCCARSVQNYSSFCFLQYEA